MPYPDNYSGASRQVTEVRCKDCGYFWEVEGETDFGSWEPCYQGDMTCPKCESENTE